MRALIFLPPVFCQSFEGSEVATYPERCVGQQLTRDLILVYLDRGELPEAVTLVLRPKGKYRIPSRRNLRSRRGLSSCSVKCRVVELWTIPAEELLAAEDVGLIPWVPLTDFAEPPETVIRRCREIIDRHAPAGEKANLLAVTQVLTGLRYNIPGLMTILGGEQAMIESPVLEEFVAKRVRATAQRDILTFLETRFGPIPQDLAEQIRSVTDEDRLTDLVRKAASCPDLEAFAREVKQ